MPGSVAIITSASFCAHILKERQRVKHELLKDLPEEQTDEIYFTETNDANVRSTLGHRPNLVEGKGGKYHISEDHGLQDHEINFMHALNIADDARRLHSQDAIDEATFGRRLNTHLFKRWFECGDKRLISSQEAYLTN